MADYVAPVKDMNYLLYDVFKNDQLWPTLPKLAEHVDRETSEAILQECAKIAEQVIAPLSRQGDETGVSFDNGKVTTAPGYKVLKPIILEKVSIKNIRKVSNFVLSFIQSIPYAPLESRITSSGGGLNPAPEEVILDSRGA